MSEIKLTRRYPDSRPEDITDAYMRGVAAGMEIANSQHERRTDALERRIDRIDGMLDGMGKGIEARLLDAESRIAAIERKLTHKTRDAK